MADTTTTKPSIAEKAREMLTGRLSELQEQQTEVEQKLNSLRSEASEIQAMLNPAQPETKPAQRQRSTRQPSPNGNGPAEPSGRAKAFLDSVKKNPGQTVVFHAAKMGLKQPNYLYRIRATLEDQNLLRREGDGLVAVEN